MSMHSEIINNKFKFVIVILLFFMVSCAAEKRYNVLRVFFDGVPKPGDKKQETTGSGIQAQQQKKQERVSVVRIKSSHPDYNTRGCDNCHDRSATNFLRTKKKDLCFKCHKEENFNGKYVHGPVAVKACLTCHLPHESVNKKLLRAPDMKLCLQCHQTQQMSAPLPCKQNDICSKCHLPHRSTDKFFLKANDSSAPIEPVIPTGTRK